MAVRDRWTDNYALAKVRRRKGRARPRFTTNLSFPRVGSGMGTDYRFRLRRQHEIFVRELLCADLSQPE